VVVDDDKLGKLIEKAGEAADNTLAVLNAEDLNLGLCRRGKRCRTSRDTARIEIDDAPVVRYLQKIMLDAITWAHPTSISSLTKSITASATGVTVCSRGGAAADGDQGQGGVAHQGVVAGWIFRRKRVPQDGRDENGAVEKSCHRFPGQYLPTLYGEKNRSCVFSTPPAPSWAWMRWATSRGRKKSCWTRCSAPTGMGAGDRPTGSGKTVSLTTPA